MFRSQRGQVASEYLGLLLVIAAIVGALAASGFRTRIAEHAQAAICTIAGESCDAAGADQGDVDRAAVERAAADLRGLLGEAPAPAAVAAFFSGLDPEVAHALALEHPELVGNLDGAPIGLRYAANAEAIDREIARLQAAGVDEDDARLRKLRELDDPDRHFLLFDPAGDGRPAEVFGDLEHARHVAVVVPGMNNELNNFNGGNADRVQAQASEFDPELEAAAESLGPVVQVAPGERVPPSPCDDPRRREVTGGYRIRLALGPTAQPAKLLEQAEAFWRKRGREVRVRGRHGRFPAVFATADPGWTFALQVFPERDEALLSGGTPCLPEPAA